MVVLAIIIMLSSMSMAVFSHLRGLSRDTVRLMNISQLQVALRSYYRDQGAYPPSIVTDNPIVSGATTYMTKVPSYPLPVDGPCPAGSGYAYTQDNAGSSYHINFCLGDNTSDMPKGNNIAIPGGIISAP